MDAGKVSQIRFALFDSLPKTLKFQTCFVDDHVLSFVDLTDKLHSKEDEFASLCSELQVIKDTTLGKQR